MKETDVRRPVRPVLAGAFTSVASRSTFARSSVVDGSCLPFAGDTSDEKMRGLTIPDVRIAAYARVSYGAP